jgi:hypothetical protein
MSEVETWKSFVGPIAVAHPFIGTDPLLSVDRSAALASAINSIGIATITFLQESRGRPGAMSESRRKEHCMRTLMVCHGLALPDYWEDSSGCQSERALMIALKKPVFYCQLVPHRESRESICGWVLDSRLKDWAESIRMIEGNAITSHLR